MRIIFHFPTEISFNYYAASHLRPQKMIKAFEKLGYSVSHVMGNSKKRKNQINEIKKNIKRGLKYDFIYAENTTTPLILQDKNKISIFKSIDYNFFKFCKSYNILIALFYRDLYWRFKLNDSVKTKCKNFLKFPFHYYDLYQYKKWVDKIYFPTYHMYNYLPKNFVFNYDQLEPGLEINYNNIKYSISNKIKLIYAGAFANKYQMHELFKAVSNHMYFELVICTTNAHWNWAKNYYSKSMSNNISIKHVAQEKMHEEYMKADIGLWVINKNEYMNISFPYKIMEYLGNFKPIVVTKNTPVGEFVETNDIGWTIEYNYKSIRKFLDYLSNNTYEIQRKIENLKLVVSNHTWEMRAQKVANDLKMLKSL